MEEGDRRHRPESQPTRAGGQEDAAIAAGREKLTFTGNLGPTQPSFLANGSLSLEKLRLTAVEESAAGSKRGPKNHILNEALSENTALIIAKAMKPTKTKTPSSTALAITRVKPFS
jgi:hypothetical protein